MEEEAPSGSAAGIFALLLTLSLLLKCYTRFMQGGQLKPQERELLKEIKELHRSANELSSPDTFTKSAKLKRTAAAKQKELTLLREKLALKKGWWVLLYSSVPKVLKVAVYLVLVQWFWHTSLANIPVALLKPAEYFLYIGKRDASGALVTVGIVPWLILSSQVSEYLSEKIAGNTAAKPTSQKS